MRATIKDVAMFAESLVATTPMALNNREGVNKPDHGCDWRIDHGYSYQWYDHADYQ